MEKILAELASLVGGELRGPPHLIVRGLAAIERAGPEDITFVAHPKYARHLSTTRAAAVVVPPDLATAERPLIVVENPYLAYAALADLFAPPRRRWVGVSHQAWIGREVRLGQDISIAPFVSIGDGVTLGDRVTLMTGTILGDGVTIGADCLLHPHVTILEGCTLGQGVIVHSGAVIGSDGFGYAFDGEKHRKIPQLGTVVIEDEVEIGANCAVDRGALGETRICRGAKIDNLVQVAHNVVVGEHSILVAQVGISGSTRLGRHVVLAGQVGVAGHLELGDGVRVGAQSGIPNSVPAGQTLTGYPAQPHPQWLRTMAALPKVPDLIKKIKRLEKRVESLTQALAKEPEV